MKNQARKERGLRAKRAREAVGLSQSDMANRIGCSRQLIGSIEKGGNMNLEQLEAYCVHAKCSADSLMFGVPDEEQEDDAIARQFARLEPWLRARLWMLYQVFVRPGARAGEREPTREA